VNKQTPLPHRNAEPPAPDTHPPIPDTRYPIPPVGRVRWSELPAVARLQTRAFRPGLAYRFSSLVMLRSIPWVTFLVARQDGGVAGCVIGDLHEGNSRIANLAVDPAWRRRGIATALLAAAERDLPQGDLILMVEAGNEAAKALYGRCGYLQTGPAPNYYGPGRHGIWMRKARPGGVPKVRT
jgi:[ribosomal protein S18]-alanine N-acetyltransferase